MDKPLLGVLKAVFLLSSCLSAVLLLLPSSIGPGDPSFPAITCFTHFTLHFTQTSSLYLCDRSHLALLQFQLADMVLVTPKFVLVAALASLTAFSLAPPADAAAITMRRSHQQHISDSSEAWYRASGNHVDHPALPLPARLMSASGKQTQDRNRSPLKGSMKVTNACDHYHLNL
jgi:hypothetical protein